PVSFVSIDSWRRQGLFQRKAIQSVAVHLDEKPSRVALYFGCRAFRQKKKKDKSAPHAPLPVCELPFVRTAVDANFASVMARRRLVRAASGSFRAHLNELQRSTKALYGFKLHTHVSPTTNAGGEQQSTLNEQALNGEDIHSSKHV
ncbi:unnamed protein product, partial [Ectocarpus sp. 4 AP-2014]